MNTFDWIKRAEAAEAALAACRKAREAEGEAAEAALAEALSFMTDYSSAQKIGKLESQLAKMREALRIIAGERQCMDNLMSNQDIARAALASTQPKDE